MKNLLNFTFKKLESKRQKKKHYKSRKSLNKM